MSSNRQYFLQYLAQTTGSPLMLEVERAEGIYLYTPEGKKIVDLISGIGVSGLGHNHPKVKKAVIDQVEKHMHTMVYGELIQAPQVHLAKALCETLPDSLNNVYLVNSGSEAIEGALKLAKRHTGKSKIISCHNAYHGSTHGALSMAGADWLKEGFQPLLPGIEQIHFGQPDDLDKIDETTAAVVMETVQGEAGIRIASQAYFSKLREICKEKGALLILDEIQAGFGRTGKFWAFEHYDIAPDILVTAKGMGGGMPIGAFISSKEIMQSLMQNPILGHITTFGGHPVSAASSLATINELTSSGLIEQVNEKADLFIEAFSNHPMVKEVRNKGLMMAVEFESFELLQKIIKKMLENGVMTDWFLFCDNSMRIAPPLIITKDEIVDITKRILKTLEEIS